MFTSRLFTWLLALGTVVAISSVTELPTNTAGTKSAMGFIPASALAPTPGTAEVVAQIASEARAGGCKVIPLAFHIDYWNCLGWKAPCSNIIFSRRQGEYSRAIHFRNVYTPQMVVNGTEGFAGGR